MNQISYKTRGNIDPQGKPRVYFLHHPDDFELYFETISDEILSVSNCAVYYFEKDTDIPDDEDEYSAFLSQMQLFVMPVTTKLLTEPNRALDIEFKFAVEHRIPVLPLMQESGLDWIFNQKCGDLQYLDKNVSDATAISYNEKLNKYIRSILLEDRMLEVIRETFDAYIFLSYRKKDRKYAQELMRLIHKNHISRYVAIWYDEFLIPGENFNDAIRDAITKSKLFVMTVTPSIIEDDNYVIHTEFPTAKKLGMPILAVEIVPTDGDKLKKKFDGIGDIVNANDAQNLENQLQRLLSEAIRTKHLDEMSKEHLSGIAYLAGVMSETEEIKYVDEPFKKYLMGLAYLSGIDVMRDTDCALELITEAAESGVIEAMEKLAEMYRDGDGVERNYSNRIFWLQKRADLAERIYLHDLDRRITHIFNRIAEQRLESLTDLGDALYEFGMISEAYEVYSKYINIALSFENKIGYADVLSNMSLVYFKLGNICMNQRLINLANDNYQKFMEITRSTAYETEENRTQYGLSLGYGKLGDICMLQDDYDGAAEYYQKLCDTVQSMAANSNSAEIRNLTASGYNRLGNICELKDDYEKAKECYLKSYEITKTVVIESGAAEDLAGLLNGLKNLGNICLAAGELDEAREYCQKSLEMSKSLVDKTGTLQAQNDLMDSYYNLGQLSAAENDCMTAKEYGEKALAIAKELSSKINTVAARRDVSRISNFLGIICVRLRDINGAKAYFQCFLDITHKDNDTNSSVQTRKDLATACYNLGCIYEAEENFQRAKELYKEAIEIRKYLAEEIGTAEVRSALADCYDHFSNICIAEYDFETADAFLTLSLGIRGELVQETNSEKFSYKYAGTIDKLGSLRQDKTLLTLALCIFYELSTKYSEKTEYTEKVNEIINKINDMEE